MTSVDLQIAPACEIDERVAVLITCYNRHDVSIRSLRQLFAQELPRDASIHVFLVDDGCSDGTGDSVRAEFPQVRLLQGDGSLYWSGGMRMAFGEALKEGFDFYLWLNDDTLLDAGAIANLLATHRALSAQGESRAIVVGSTRDPETGALTYGGVVRASRVHPFKFRLVEPNGTAQQCITMNGNVVLIPRPVAEIVGNISKAFRHGMGDFDYGLRARRLGCTVWVAPHAVGVCRKDRLPNAWQNMSLSFHQWMRRAAGIKGLPPGDYWRFAQAHGGILWPIYWAMPYVRAALAWASASVAR